MKNAQHALVESFLSYIPKRSSTPRKNKDKDGTLDETEDNSVQEATNALAEKSKIGMNKICKSNHGNFI